MCYLRKNHLAPSSQRTYASALKIFQNFCRKNDHPQNPCREETLLRFVAYLFRQDVSHRTVTVYLAAIRKNLEENGRSSVMDSLKLKQVLTGYKRATNAGEDTRLPITLDLMRLIKVRLSKNDSLEPHDKAMLWSACTLAFFAFLRVSEFTAGSSNSKKTVLKLHNLSTANGSLEVTIPSSKTDQFGHGYKITVSATNRSVCAVRAADAYLKYRLRMAAPNPALFLYADTRALTTSLFASELKNLLRGVPQSNRYSSHSFRIGATSAAAANGASSGEIQRAGRWKSNCFETYVRSQVPIQGTSLYPLRG